MLKRISLKTLIAKKGEGIEIKQLVIIIAVIAALIILFLITKSIFSRIFG